MSNGFEQDFGSILANAVIRAESSGNPNAVSPVGAQGLMQLMPATGQELARNMGLNYNPFDAQQNQLLGTTYLNQMYDQFQDPRLALAAYNAGPGRVQKTINELGTADPSIVLSALPEETQAYVPKVLQFANQPQAMVEAGAPTLNSSPALEVLTDADFISELENQGDKGITESLPILTDADFDPSEVLTDADFIDQESSPDVAPQREYSWGDLARGVGGSAVQGFSFNLGDEAGIVDKQFNKDFTRDYPITALSSEVAGSLAPLVASYFSTAGTAGATAPAAVATTAKTASTLGKLGKALMKAGDVGVQFMKGPSLAKTPLGRVAKATTYGASTGALSGYGSAEEGERGRSAIRGAVFGGSLGGLMGSGGEAIQRYQTSSTLDEPVERLSRKLISSTDRNLSEAADSLSKSTQPVFLPEALNSADFYGKARAIANDPTTKDIVSDVLKDRATGQVRRVENVLNGVAPRQTVPLAAKKIKSRADSLAEKAGADFERLAESLLDDVAPASSLPVASKQMKRAAESVVDAKQAIRDGTAFENFKEVYKNTPALSPEETTNIYKSPIAEKTRKKLQEYSAYRDLPTNSTKLAHAVKSDLWADAQTMANANRKRIQSEEADNIRKILHEVPGMKEADAIYEAQSRELEDLVGDTIFGKLANKSDLSVSEVGKKLLSSDTDIADIKKLVQQLGEDGDNLIASAIRANLDDLISKKGSAGVLFNNKLKGKLTQVLGKEKAGALYSKLEAEQTKINSLLKDTMLGRMAKKSGLSISGIGGEILDPNRDIADVKKLIGDLGPDGEKLVLSAVRAKMSQDMGQRLKDTSVMSVFDKANVKDRLTQLLGANKASSILKALDEESLIAKGSRNYVIGSPTQPAFRDQNLLDKSRDALSYYSRNPTEGIGDVLTALVSPFFGASDDVLNKEARIIFSNKEAKDALAQILAERMRVSGIEQRALAPRVAGAAIRPGTQLEN